MKKTLQIIAYILFLFLFQEGVLRYCFPIPELENFDRNDYMKLYYNGGKIIHARNKTWLWQSQPDTTAVFKHRMNLYGFMDIPWKIKKPKNTKRVLFIGDSFVEGVMASNTQTIPSYFNKASNNTYQVFNGGMLGCGLSSYLQLAADAIPIFKPEIAIMCIYANDLGKNYPLIPANYLEPIAFNSYRPRLLEFFKQQKSFGPLGFRFRNDDSSYIPAVPNKANPWTHHRDSLQQDVHPKLATAMMQSKFNPFLKNSLYKEARFLKAPPKLGDAIPFFEYTCKKFGVQPIVVYIPSRNQITNYYLPFEKTYCLNECSQINSLITPQYQQHQQIIKQHCKKFNVPFIDVTNTLKKEEGRGNHLYWNYDQHMLAKGYKLVGEYIWEEFSKL